MTPLLLTPGKSGTAVTRTAVAVQTAINGAGKTAGRAAAAKAAPLPTGRAKPATRSAELPAVITPPNVAAAAGAAPQEARTAGLTTSLAPQDGPVIPSTRGAWAEVTALSSGVLARAAGVLVAAS